jgi:tRNA(fMet)-specific endonuclease VapC
VTFVLDTNTCIGVLNGRSPAVLKMLEITPPEEISVCSIVKAELFYGAAKSRRPESSLRAQRAFLELYRSIPFDDAAAEAYGRIRSDLESRGAPIGPNDLLIAATAVAHDLTLVTHYTNEFARVEMLALVDWEQ